MNHCPYCSAGLDEIKGEVYCSQHMTCFDALESGIFPINGNGFDSGDHISRFSIRFVLGGFLTYTIDKSQYQIFTPCVTLFNEFVDYLLKVPIQNVLSSQVGIALNPSKLRSASAAFTESSEKLLDNPEVTNDFFTPISSIWNFSKKAEQLSSKIQNVISLKGVNKSDAKDEIVSDILEWYFQENSRFGGYFSTLNDVKKNSTKEELVRRLEIANELIQYSNHSTLKVSDLAKQSSLSEFHFIRLYKKMYGKSPYQDVLQKKMKKAMLLLETTSLSIFEVAISVGYEDQSSLSRLFKNHFGVTPLKAKKGT